MSSYPDDIKHCKNCRLRENASQVVPGEGPLDAETLFIGEAPGYYENEKGRPFIGRAGSALDSILRDLSLRRDLVRITNIVKCWPPGNRNPQPDEIAACQKWLDAEVEQVHPKLIVCLGAFAAGRYFPDKAKIGSFRALPDGTIITSVYHPAFFLRGRRPAIRQQILNGIREGLELCERR